MNNQKPKLSEKQLRFCQEYIIDLNGTAAAKRAGYSAKTAAVIASEHLTKPNIHAYIQQLIAERAKRVELDADFVIKGLIDVSLRCRQAIPVMKWDAQAKEMVQVTDDEDRAVWEFDSNGANRALELLGRHLGIFEKDNTQKNKIMVKEVGYGEEE